MTSKTNDVVALGETLIDFTEAGLSPNGQRLFEQNPGGAPANVLSAVAKLGFNTAFIGTVGNDMHGRYLRSVLLDAGINADGLEMTDKAFTTLAFVALDNGERSFSFARKPGADTLIEYEKIDLAILDSARIFHFGSLSLTDEPARTATFKAVEHAKNQGALISYDPNYRANLWPSQAAAQQMMRKPIPYVDIMKISDEETTLLTGHHGPEAAAKHLLQAGVKLVAVTLGKKGALVANANGMQVTPGFDIPAVDSTGAGDAFWGGFLAWLLRSGKAPQQLGPEELVSIARFANAAATVCVTRRGAIAAMPTHAEVDAILQSAPLKTT